ncbi:GerAB/ArcD/ProY family transporter [Dethiothermospora halolimnae]|uniref:GerAB/ArcD/ProY family transporter n=1 Tax=Dethiothermospora halolimnae TaxID=3114390 RepID=UPI003CCB812C
MKREIISEKQGISMIILFVVGISTTIVMGLEAKQDLWLAILFAVIMLIPLLVIYSRLHKLFPKKNFFDIVEICLGRVLGRFIIILYIWFSFYLGVLVLRDFGEFYFTIVSRETPMMVPIIMISLLVIWILKEGLEVLGRFSQYFAIVFGVFLFITFLLLIPDMDINNLKPVLYNGIKPVLNGAFSTFGFPLGEIVIFMLLFSSFSQNGSPLKVYILGGVVSGIIILFASVANILVIGVKIVEGMYFPSYATASRLNIGDFLSRIEIVVAFIFVIGGFVKLTICLLGTCNGIKKLFNLKDYRIIVTPIVLLLINLCYFIYDGTIEFYAWTKDVWRYYAFPFQVIIPIFVYIVAEIKIRVYKKRKKSLN